MLIKNTFQNKVTVMIFYVLTVDRLLISLRIRVTMPCLTSRIELSLMQSLSLNFLN